MDYWTALQHRGMLYAKCPDEVWIGAAIAGHDGVRELAGHERACGASRTALKGGERRWKAGEGGGRRVDGGGRRVDGSGLLSSGQCLTF